MEGNQPVHSEEIDLSYFFRPIVKSARAILQAVARYFSILRANLVLFLCIVVLVSAMGFVLRYVVPGQFVTEGTFASRLLPTRYCDILTNDLDSHTGERLLEQQLHLAPETADQIRAIRLTPIDELLDSKDSSLRSFTLHLRLEKMDQLDSIQQALIAYYDNNEYAVKRKMERKNRLLALRTEMIAKIASLDSLSPIVNSSIVPRSTGQGIILGQPVDPVSIYQAQVAYYQQQIDIERELTNLDNIEVVQPFLRLTKPNYPHFNQLLLGAFIVGLLIALFLTPVYGKRR